MKQRIITGIIFGVVSLSLILYSDFTRAVFLYLAVTLSAIEYVRLISSRLLPSIISVFIVLFPAVLQYWGWFQIDDDQLQLFNFVIAALLLGLLFSLRIVDVGNIHKQFWPPIVFLLFSSSAFLFHQLIWKSQINYLLLIIIFIWLADSGAYFVGKALGKNKFAPRISPNKTWEGFLGAGVVVIIAAIFIKAVFPDLNLNYSIIITAICVWLFGALGDLFQSHLKRAFDQKDSGNLLPGHGGFYDRFDGFIYALPFASMSIILFS